MVSPGPNWSQSLVPKLQDLCFRVVYKDLVCKVTPTTSNFVRGFMDDHLVGRVKKAVRDECFRWLSGFNFMQDPIDQEENTVLDVCAILDCILYEDLLEFKVAIPHPIIYFFSEMMTIISNRSPQLKKLEISYITIETDYRMMNPNMKSGFRTKISDVDSLLFQNLISLKLQISQAGLRAAFEQRLRVRSHFGAVFPITEFDNPDVGRPIHHGLDQLPLSATAQQSVLSIIEKRCPVLAQLTMCGFRCFSKRDMSTLLLGDMAAALSYYNNDYGSSWGAVDSVMEVLRVPSEFLSPLCFTLKELHLLYNDRGPDNSSECINWDSHSVFAFTFRHLPKLLSFKYDTSSRGVTVQVIKVLFKVKNVDLGIQQLNFEELCRKVATSIGKKLDASRPSISSGFLSMMTHMDIPLSIDDLDMLRAVGSLCPHLKCVTFSDRIQFFSPAIRSQLPFPDNEVHLILKEWPKVETINFSNLDREEWAKSILGALGPALKNLTFSCNQLYLSDLVNCTQLESLTISRANSLAITAHPSNWNPVTFLPCLKRLESSICLGMWSSLLESKPTLTSLKLVCCHIGSEISVPRLNWIQVPEFWQNLEHLEMLQCSGLTVTVLSQIIPRLKKLQKIGLPRRFNTRESLEDFVDKETLIEIVTWPFSYSTTICSFMIDQLQ